MAAQGTAPATPTNGPQPPADPKIPKSDAAVNADDVKNWYLATDLVSRMNRNILQYGAALAAAIAAFAGSGAVLAVADAVRPKEDMPPVFPDWVAHVSMGVGAFLFVLLSLLVGWSILRHGLAERDAAKYLGKIILKNHGRFLPKGQADG